MKSIKINKHKIYYQIGYRTLIYERTIEEFMEFNPPCKECIVQAVCVSYTHPIYVEYKDATHEEFLLIEINGCKKLNEFIYGNPSFYIYDDEPRRRKGKEKEITMNRLRDPEPNEINTPEFNTIWECIKHWDIGLPYDITVDGGQLYSGATKNHVVAILDALRKNKIIK